MKTSFRIFALVCVTLGFLAPAMQAEDLGTVKARMVQRLGELDALKAKGAIGETNQGLVVVRGDGAKANQVVAAENSDREVAYAAIAKQTGSSVSQVARARARQIAANSAKGVWLQRDNGSWYQK